MDIREAEKYNEKLRALKSKTEQLQSEKAIYERQLAESCKKLTELLGIPVTPENIQQVYDEYMAKVENTVAAGMEIMARIDGTAPVQTEQVQPATPAQEVTDIPPVQPIQGATAAPTGIDPYVAFGMGTPATPQADTPEPVPTPTQTVAPDDAPQGEPPLLWGGDMAGGPQVQPGATGQPAHTWGSPSGQGIGLKI